MRMFNVEMSEYAVKCLAKAISAVRVGDDRFSSHEMKALVATKRMFDDALWNGVVDACVTIEGEENESD